MKVDQNLLSELEKIEKEIKELKKRNRESKVNELITQKQIQLAESDLLTFVAIMWKHAGTKGKFKSSWYVEAICEHLQALYELKINKLAIQIMPRSGKSSICSVLYHPWIWIIEPEFALITSSYGADLSKRDAVRSKQLIQTSDYQTNWGYKFKFSDTTNRQDRYENTKGGYRIATSVDGKGTGEGGDLLLVDDPHKAKEFDSPAKKKEVINWYTGTMQSRYREALKFRELLIHQRGAPDDLIGYMLKTEVNEWTVLKLPTEYVPTTYVTSIGWKDPRTEPGEWLDEDRLPKELGIKIKLNKSKVWACQYQQEPDDVKAGYLDKKYIRYYCNATRPPLNDFILVSSIDFADGSQESNASDTCIQIWGILKSSPKKKYLLDEYSDKYTFPQQLDLFETICAKYSTLKTHLIEFKSNAQSFIHTIELNIKENTNEVYKQIATHNFIKINPKDYGGTKDNRFESCIPQFIEGNIYLPDEQTKPGISKTIDQLIRIPNSVRRDSADSLSQLINYFIRNPNYDNLTTGNLNMVGISYEDNKLNSEIHSLFDYEYNTTNDFRDAWSEISYDDYI